MAKISIVIPVYNEEKAVSLTISKIKQAVKNLNHDLEIIAVNDCSKDKSGKILDEIKDIKVIHHVRNKGYGSAVKTGIRQAKGDWILITDADGTYPVEDIPKLLHYINKYDMVIGARIGKIVKIPFFRRPAKWFLNSLAGYLAESKIPDLNSGFRIFKKGIALKYWTLFPDRFSFTSTITMACLTNGYDLKYIPVNYYKRKGKSDIHPVKDFIGFNSLLIRLITYFRPIKVFMPVALSLFLVGLIKGVADFLGQGHIGSAAIIAVLTAIHIGFLGLIADLIIKRTQL
jgi:glycosyltransferase involved in cell wall biosynthesis